MQVLSRHYHQCLGLNSDWAISHVKLYVQSQTLTMFLEFVGNRVVCRERGVECPVEHHAAERGWRHLVAMKFQTTLPARIPHRSFVRCGVKQISVKSAEKHCRLPRQ